ncbi:Uncharacterised protein r2_g3216 [Pycnogonum litorale]
MIITNQDVVEHENTVSPQTGQANVRPKRKKSTTDVDDGILKLLSDANQLLVPEKQNADQLFFLSLAERIKDLDPFTKDEIKIKCMEVLNTICRR